MTTVLVVNGPNINMLGTRNSEQYGSMTLNQIEHKMISKAKDLGLELLFIQSNNEGSLVDFVQQNGLKADGIIINPAGLTRIGFPLLDACIDSKLPMVEVHLSNPNNREIWRQGSIFSAVCNGSICGLRWMGYIAAIEYLSASLSGEI
jgi:3-dehydroquinate dehydratase-2